MGGSFDTESLEINSSQWINEDDKKSLMPLRPYVISSSSSEPALSGTVMNNISKLLPCHGKKGLEELIDSDVHHLGKASYRGVELKINLVHAPNGHSKYLKVVLRRKLVIDIPNRFISEEQFFGRKSLNLSSFLLQKDSKYTGARGSLCPFYNDGSLIHLVAQRVDGRARLQVLQGASEDEFVSFEEEEGVLLDGYRPYIRTFRYKPWVHNPANDTVLYTEDLFTSIGVSGQEIVKVDNSLQYSRKNRHEVEVRRKELLKNSSTGISSRIRCTFMNRNDSEVERVFYEDFSI